MFEMDSCLFKCRCPIVSLTVKLKFRRGIGPIARRSRRGRKSGSMSICVVCNL